MCTNRPLGANANQVFRKGNALMLNGRTVVAGVAMTLFFLAAGPAKAAVPYVSGTYTTPNASGGFKFTPVRAIQGGFEGRFVVGGKAYLGSIYAIRGTSDTGMVWYYGVTGIPAGSARVSPNASGLYSGPISFTNLRGQTTDSGRLTVTITLR